MFEDLAHVPVFAGVAALLMVFLSSSRSALKGVGLTVAACGALALVVEVEQLVTRSGEFELRDLWFDVVGTAIGLVLATAGLRLGRPRLFSLAVVIGVVASLFLLPVDDGPPAFVYESDAVERRCQEEVPPVLADDRRDPPEELVRYLFDENGGHHVHDAVGDLDLTIENRDAAEWLAGGGVAFNGEAPGMSSDQPARELAGKVVASDEVSVEAWFTPASLPQRGPVRLVTVSEGTDFGEANVHVGIEGRAVSFRVRTDCDHFNWTLTDDVLVVGERHHVVATYRPGSIRIVLDGTTLVEASVQAGVLDPWDPTLRLHVADEATGDRPYTGTIHQIAIYDRVLTVREIVEKFRSGPTG